MKRRKANSKKSARMTRRQRRLYLDILWAIKEKNKNFDNDTWHRWQGNGLASSAYHFARRWGGRKDVHVGKLQNAVIRFGSGKIIFRFALNIPEANINRLQYAIINCDNPIWIRKFAKYIPNAKKEMLESVAMVAEIMEDMA